MFYQLTHNIIFFLFGSLNYVKRANEMERITKENQVC